ncbi:hypothetical protein IJ847_00430 [Candidatus Saccharibacteria bacterium]|nr:hypothetical protein [Candidatus Saccharibacteria bacterium]
MKRINNYRPPEPPKCWVGDKHKVCYPDRETAEMSARLVEAEHGLPGNSLTCYRCEYGNHWHLANKK